MRLLHLPNIYDGFRLFQLVRFESRPLILTVCAKSITLCQVRTRAEGFLESRIPCLLIFAPYRACPNYLFNIYLLLIFVPFDFPSAMVVRAVCPACGAAGRTQAGICNSTGGGGTRFLWVYKMQSTGCCCTMTAKPFPTPSPAPAGGDAGEWGVVCWYLVLA